MLQLVIQLCMVLSTPYFRKKLTKPRKMYSLVNLLCSLLFLENAPFHTTLPELEESLISLLINSCSNSLDLTVTLIDARMSNSCQWLVLYLIVKRNGTVVLTIPLTFISGEENGGIIIESPSKCPFWRYKCII